MYRNLDMTALRSFIAIADTGGVTRAASKLHLTQSAVTMQIKRLEASLDQPLLERIGRGVQLTKQGEQLVSYGRRILSLNDEIWRRLTDDAFEGQVVLGVPQDIVYPHIPTILRSFATDFPRANVRLVTGATAVLKERFTAGDLDLILTTELAPSGNAELLREEELMWFGVTDGTAWRRRPLPIAYEKNCVFRAIAIAALDRANIAWDAPFGASDWRDYSAFVSADLAVTGILLGTHRANWSPVPEAAHLPELPRFGIYLYIDEERGDSLAHQLAGYVRDEYFHQMPYKGDQQMPLIQACG